MCATLSVTVSSVFNIYVYLALPLCIVSMHLTRCVSFFFLFNLLFFEAAFYANKDLYITPNLIPIP